MQVKPSRRPRIDVPKTLPDYFGQVLALAGAGSGLLLILIILGALPEQVPGLFGITDDPAEWSGRWSAAVGVVVALVIFAAMTVLARVPHIYNYPWSITEQNAAIQYRLARSMVIWLNALSVLMLLSIVWSQVWVALGDLEQVNPFMIMGFIIVIHTVLVLFVYRAYRCQDGDLRNDPLDRSRA